MDSLQTNAIDRTAEIAVHVTVKWAQTLDGRIATASGSSRWISSSESRSTAHELRAEHDAILVGIDTVLADDPELTVRHCAGRNPVPIVIDSRLRCPLAARLLKSSAPHHLIATGAASRPDREANLRNAGATVLHMPAVDTARVNLRALMARLPQLGIRSVLVEGGAKIITSFLQEQLADEIAVFVAPKIVGCGVSAVQELHIHSLPSAITVCSAHHRLLGPDILVRGAIRYGAAVHSDLYE